MRKALPLSVSLAGLSMVSLIRGASSAVEWHEYLGGPDRNHYSTLSQIGPGNVKQLQVAWEYHTGDFGQMQCNPIIVDGVLYGASASAEIFALDAATGRERWKYSEGQAMPNRTIRGVSYWKSGDDERIFFAIDDNLCAIDARTGKLIPTFGSGGKASLRQGLGPTSKGKFLVSTTPGTIFRDLIVMPIRVEETEEAGLAHVQAFDVRTGKLAWVFHTIPEPGEFGYATWPPQAYKNTAVGAANCWSGMALDTQRGILFVPTGSASPDFWGGNRKGQNLFANCLIALDAATGKRLWHYQFIHHDIWDRDLPAPPNLITIHRHGRAIDAVAQVTKQGYVFVFDRVTGEPLFPIQEVPVPAARLPGDEAWPTQPIPLQPAPYARETLTEKDFNPYSENRDTLQSVLKTSRLGAFEPFGAGTTLLFPGFDGGAEWGGAAADPDGTLYVNATAMAWLVRMVEKPKPEALAKMTLGRQVYSTLCIGCHGEDRAGHPTSGIPSLVEVKARKSRDDILKLIDHGRGMMPSFPWLEAEKKQALIDYVRNEEKSDAAAALENPNKSGDLDTPYRLDGYVKFLDAKGYPGINPPWGSLSAIDLNTGEYRWKITLGEFKELTAQGIPPTGAENYGGPVVTATGLLFIAATKDGMFRAFDTRTGAELWKTELPAPAFATPATYEAGGRQYVVVACGGTKLDTKTGDSYVAFALPTQP